MEEKKSQITGSDVPATWDDLKKRDIAWGEFTWGERLQRNASRTVKGSANA